MADFPDWLDDADKLDDDQLLELVGEHVDHVGHVDDESGSVSGRASRRSSPASG